MSGRAFRFRTVWRVAATREACWREVVAALQPGAATWWRGVHVESTPRTLAAGEPFVLAVRAPLGYRLRMRMRLEHVEVAACLRASAVGDLRGDGELSLSTVPDGCELVFTWTVQTTRRWMTATAWLLRPVFAAGHATIMRRGERALRRRLCDAG